MLRADYCLVAAFALMPFTAAARGEPAAVVPPRSICREPSDDTLRPLPPNLAPAARQVFALAADMPVALIVKTTSLRCMAGRIWLCNDGANLDCARANRSEISRGAAAFCRKNPDALSVPMAAAGHNTIYAWHCVGSKARRAETISAVDRRGFIAAHWRALP